MLLDIGKLYNRVDLCDWRHEEVLFGWTSVLKLKVENALLLVQIDDGDVEIFDTAIDDKNVWISYCFFENAIIQIKQFSVVVHSSIPLDHKIKSIWLMVILTDQKFYQFFLYFRGWNFLR